MFELHLAEPFDDGRGGLERRSLVVVDEENGEFVAAEAECLASLPQARRDLREDAVARRVAVLVVDPLEVVDVDEAEAELLAGVLGRDELALEPLVEVAVVSEPGQRVGQREPHRPQGPVGGALVERDREQRADQGRRKDRRALPEHDQHQRRRGHQRERDDRADRVGSDERDERAPRVDSDDERDQQQVDPVVHERSDADAEDELADVLRVDPGDRQSCEGGGASEDGRVVRHADDRAVLEQLRERPDRGQERARFPAEQHGGRDDEDVEERNAACVCALDRNGKPLREHRRSEKSREPEQITARVRLTRKRNCGPGKRDCARSADRHQHGEQPWR